MRSKRIYVEIRIRTEMDKLWSATQTPGLHAKWDLRFSDIQYLPRSDENAPQQFLYRTRIGFGLAIHGEGETVGTSEAAGARSSALKFSSADPKSLILSGSGYWKYHQTADGIRFLTLYDYQTRFGLLGGLFDHVVFRPLLGWATAWSFDCLRLWLESGIDPALSKFRSLINFLCRFTLGMAWLYQGAVPKLFFPDTGELEILRHSGVLGGHEVVVLKTIGGLEIVFGLLIFMMARQRILFLLNNIVLMVLLAGVLGQSKLLIAPFNPVSLTIAMLGLGAVGWLASKSLPSARSCLRTRVEPA